MRGGLKPLGSLGGATGPPAAAPGHSQHPLPEHGGHPIDRSSTGLLQELLRVKDTRAQEKHRREQLKAAKVVDEERRAKLEIQRMQAGEASAYATTVANSLSVVAALIASALLSVLLDPPDAMHDPSLWGGAGAGTRMEAACYVPADPNSDGAGDITICLRWQALYGISCNLALALQMVTLILTVIISLGQAGLLRLAILCFLYGLAFSLVTVLAAIWLSFGDLVAIFTTCIIGISILCGTLLLVSPAVWLYYNAVGQFQQLTFQGTPLEHTLMIQWLACGSDNPLAALPMRTYLRLLATTEGRAPPCWDDIAPPLLLAAERGRVQVVKILLLAGANPDQEFRGCTPLLVAARGGHAAVARELCLFGADPNKSGPEGQTALAAASKGGHQEVVNVLLRFKATA